MGALDPEKILVIFVLALILLGPERLPKVARQLGGAWRELSKLRQKLEAEVRAAVPDVDLPKLPTRPAAAVATFLAGLTDTSQPSNGAAPTTDAGDLVAVDGAGSDDAVTTDATTEGAAPDEAVEAVNGQVTPRLGGDVAIGEAPVAESIAANAERQMQQIAARRAAAMARAEGRRSAMATIDAGATAATASAATAPGAALPAAAGSGLEDSSIGFDDPSMN